MSWLFDSVYKKENKIDFVPNLFFDEKRSLCKNIGINS
jgi:hypothetical protein